MASLNKCFLIGNLTKDPTLKYMQNGDAVTNLSIATSETWKGKDGSKQEKTEFHSLVFYRKLAEIAGEWLKKGMPIYIEGKLQTRKWEKDGIDRYATEIIVSEMKMLGGKRGESSSEPRQQNQADTDRRREDADFEDDIPF